MYGDFHTDGSGALYPDQIPTFTESNGNHSGLITRTSSPINVAQNASSFVCGKCIIEKV